LFGATVLVWRGGPCLARRSLFGAAVLVWRDGPCLARRSLFGAAVLVWRGGPCLAQRSLFGAAVLVWRDCALSIPHADFFLAERLDRLKPCADKGRRRTHHEGHRSLATRSPSVADKWRGRARSRPGYSNGTRSRVPPGEEDVGQSAVVGLLLRRRRDCAGVAGQIL